MKYSPVPNAERAALDNFQVRTRMYMQGFMLEYAYDVLTLISQTLMVVLLILLESDRRLEGCDCICNAGSHLERPRECVPCPLDTFKSQRSDQVCRSCPAGTASRTLGSTSLQQCEASCFPGYSGIDPRYCKACLFGTYKPYFSYLDTESNCTLCPSGKLTRQAASTSADQCIGICPAGYYGIEQPDCKPCPNGTYKERVTYSDEPFVPCTACPVGYTTLSTPSLTVYDCVKFCPAGYQGSGGADCLPCPPGFYKDSSSFDESVLCTRCPSNTTSLAFASTSVADCQYRANLVI